MATLTEATNRVVRAVEAWEGLPGWYDRNRGLILERVPWYDPERALDIAALASGGMRWESVLRYLPDYATGRRKVRFPALQRAIEAVRAGREPAWGPKVAAFRRALGGDPNAVPIDRWSARLALGNLRVVRVSRDARLRAIGAHVEAAWMLGLEPRETQSRAWEAVRSGAFPV